MIKGGVVSAEPSIGTAGGEPKPRSELLDWKLKLLATFGFVAFFANFDFYCC